MPHIELTPTGGGSKEAAPSGPAGGDLTGTYPNPTIAAKAVTGAKIALRVIEKTANFTLTEANDVVIANATGGSITQTLPTAVGITGREFTVKGQFSGANTVTVATTGGQTIDGAATVVLSSTATYNSITVLSDGANWRIV